VRGIVVGGALAVAVIGCGGSASGSGVASSKKLTELSASEQDKLCTYTVDIEDGPRTVNCGDGSVSIDDKAMCVANFSQLGIDCKATVDDAEGCAEVMSKDPCNFDFNACAAFFSCFFFFAPAA
jgi:hypothetical protein